MKKLTIGLALLILAVSAFTQPSKRYGYDMPPGFIMPFAGTACPDGYFITDGTTKSRTTHARLFAVVSTFHGQGDGSTTFHIPNYQGRFLRMLDGAAGIDPDKATRTAMATGGAVGNNVGSVQNDANLTHAHNFVVSNNLGSVANSFAAANAGTPGNGVTSGGSNTVAVTSTGASEARPENAYVIYCIKY